MFPPVLPSLDPSAVVTLLAAVAAPFAVAAFAVAAVPAVARLTDRALDRVACVSRLAQARRPRLARQ